MLSCGVIQLETNAKYHRLERISFCSLRKKSVLWQNSDFFFPVDPRIRSYIQRIELTYTTMSKLALLAAQRRARNNNIEVLDLLTTPGSSSKLGSLAASRNGNSSLNANSTSSILDNIPRYSTLDEGNQSRLASILNSRNRGGIHRAPDLVKQTEKSSSVQPEKKKKIDPENKAAKLGQLDDDLVTQWVSDMIVELDSHLLLSSGSSTIAGCLCGRGGGRKRTASESDSQPWPSINKRKLIEHSIEVFGTLTNVDFGIEKIATAKENFKAPSPDDTIISAQKQAFSERMEALSIKPEGLSKVSAPQKTVKPTKPKSNIDLRKVLASSLAHLKPRKSFVVIGHVDAGKSTLMGRILFDFGIVDARTVNKLVREAEKAEKGSFALAWIMDQTSEERSHGVTIDICATDFETAHTKFTAIDAPGHRDFVPQMIGGVCQADFALLVVDAITGEFEAGFMMDGQTKEHTILAKSLGMERICVVINKMDSENWSQDRFDAIKSQLMNYLTGDEVGFTTNQVDFVPLSGLTGNNVVKRDSSISAFSWYTGPTLGQYIEEIELQSTVNTCDGESVADQLMTEPFLLSVHDTFKEKGEIIVSGKVASGVIETGELIVASPSNEHLQVQTIQVASKKVDYAIRGDLIQMSFKASQVENDLVDTFQTGDIISKLDSPVKSVKKFTAAIHLFNLTKPLLVGSPFVLFRNNCQVPARVSKLVEVTSGERRKKKTLHLVSKQTAIVEIEVETNLFAATKYDDSKTLGRIVMRMEGVTVGAGQILELEAAPN